MAKKKKAKVKVGKKKGKAKGKVKAKAKKGTAKPMGNRKMTPKDVKEVRRMTKKGMAQIEIANHFDVSRHCIGRIQQGTTWSDVA